MTDRESTRSRVYRFVRSRILAGSPPTVREIQKELGLSAAQSVQRHLDALVAAGALRKTPRISRGYTLPEEELRTLSAVGQESSAQEPSADERRVPLVGRVAAGPFSTAFQDIEGELSVADRSEHEELFALRVRGESMRDAGILPGDLVIVRRQQTAQDGDIVVARVEDDATVKRFRIRNGRPELHAENPVYSGIILPEEFVLLGKVVEVRRIIDGSGYREYHE